MKVLLVLASLCLFVSFVYGFEYGHCKLYGNSNDPTIVGDVYFIGTDTGLVRVVAKISGITQNLDVQHGMHIHTFGDLGSPTSDWAGGHYTGESGKGIHGCYPNTTRDSGDMGNWNVTVDGTVDMEKTLDLISLTGGYSIIGRAVIFHNHTDDCATVSSSAARLAQCVIGVGNSAYLPTSVGALSGNNTAFNAGNQTITTTPVAVCYPFATTGNSAVGGVVFFYASRNYISVAANITGLPSGAVRGFHLHEFGDISSGDGNSEGAHYNPYNRIHNLPPSSNRHVGDMGNLCSQDASLNTYYFYNNTLLEFSGINSLIGRTVVIHGNADNSSSVSYGPRVAHCVVGIFNPTLDTGLSAALAPPVSVSDPACGFTPIPTPTTGTSSTTSSSDATSNFLAFTAVLLSVFALLL
eukprot:TRINITY_DN1360_c0_g1_i2.p1 TRINITY_DN1360_c0_g1~~TRINITY_DN1360_c0_g1_i2.p1  ORF type:complete len:410 (+),score=78.01 TRINITY_DN1360_c0_g1_i2:195-1424(+)